MNRSNLSVLIVTHSVKKTHCIQKESMAVSCNHLHRSGSKNIKSELLRKTSKIIGNYHFVISGMCCCIQISNNQILTCCPRNWMTVSFPLVREVMPIGRGSRKGDAPTLQTILIRKSARHLRLKQRCKISF